MHSMVEQIERVLLPELQNVASDMRNRHSILEFNVWHGPEGALTDNPGYSIGIECVFPRNGGDIANNVALCIDLSQLATTPKLVADVVWGHPTGEVEISFPERCGSMDQWPEATPQTIAELAEALPKLIKAFETAVQCATPQSPPKVNFVGMTTNERLYVAGFMQEWDAATRAHNRERMIEILNAVGLGSQADQIVAAMLPNKS